MVEPTAHRETAPGQEGAPGHPGTAVEHAQPLAFGVVPAPAIVALAMTVVIILLLWKRVPAAIGKSLDGKIAAIRGQLDEAASLRKEAEALKAEYEARSAAAEQEAAAMVERARHEADAIREKAEADAAALVERRTRMAEDKIAAEERHAVQQLRATAADAASRAAARLIAERHDGQADKALIDGAIAGLGR